MAALRHRGKLRAVLIAALFIAVVPMLVLSDILEEQERPSTKRRKGALRRR
ncbi:MAG: hypothetical protein ACN4GT_11670 [Gammaproteobacteria bacterium]